MNDPVDEFLDSHLPQESPPGLREALLARTLQVVRGRRRVRRLLWASALAACFLAGMLTMNAWQGVAPQPVQAIIQPAAPAPKSDVPPAPSGPPLSLAELEWRAFDSRDNRAALFFEVGHRYFEDLHDYDAALRCYRQALAAAHREGLAVQPDDNWLVMALKEARQKETSDALANP